MPIRNFRPTSPGRRGATGFTFDEIDKKAPEKRLTISKSRIDGRSRGSGCPAIHGDSSSGDSVGYGLPGLYPRVEWCESIIGETIHYVHFIIPSTR